mgnify:FL=1
MSTLKADAVTAKSTNTDVVITGAGTGVPDIETGFKVSGTAGLPVNNLRAGTDGELITWDASGDPATVAVGTATHVLTSNGTGAAPTFQAAAGGGGGAWTYISSVTASSSATVDFTSGIGSTYDLYVITWADVVPVTDNVDFRMRTTSNAGGLWDDGGSDYDYYTSRWQTGTGSHSTAATVTGSAMSGPSGNGSAAGEGMTGWLMFGSPDNTALLKTFIWHWTMIDNAGNTVICPGGGARMATPAIDGIRFYFSSGNVESGTFRLYGIANS